MSNVDQTNEAGTMANSQFSICTAGLRYFDLSQADRQRVSIDDIATALANLCRFTGHTQGFYSVAQHCVLVSDQCPNYPLAGLLHDAHEAYIGDISRPLKLYLNSIAATKGRPTESFGQLLVSLAYRVDVAIGQEFGLSPADFHAPEVTLADNRLLATEKRDVMKVPETTIWAGLPEPLPNSIRLWKPSLARSLFLERFYKLTGRRPA